ncbi:hypothetical protein PVAG01_03028 [Phlyctema vagabunda]|uniref:Uncharacterized protein n=1 Tax=Phlyctema vagabunda TaxID=108571 RepID=A0ABR4PSB4_9HELO
MSTSERSLRAAAALSTSCSWTLAQLEKALTLVQCAVRPAPEGYVSAGSRSCGAPQLRRSRLARGGKKGVNCDRELPLRWAQGKSHEIRSRADMDIWAAAAAAAAATAIAMFIGRPW